MSTRIAVANRIVIAIAIEVQAIDGLGVKVGGIVGADEAAPFGGVIPGVAVVQTGVIRTTIATGTKTGKFATSKSSSFYYSLLM